MEIERQCGDIKKWFSDLFLMEPKPFSNKRDLNWGTIKKLGGVGVGVTVLTLLALPNTKTEKVAFHEEGTPGSGGQMRQAVVDPSPSQGGQGALAHVPASLDYLYQKSATSGTETAPNREAAMILPREGLDSRTQLPPGSRIGVRLLERAIIATQALPVIGLVSRDLIYEDAIAIPQGSKVYGEVAFDDAAERASVSWRMIELPDGRRRQLAAVGVGLDGQVGVEGRVHSDALKNTIGETITRFIGAYAQGSMQQGSLGSAPGGSENGLKNAVAETAKARADAWGEDMKKEKKWIELEPGTESVAVLTQSFLFRDPGATYGGH